MTRFHNPYHFVPTSVRPRSGLALAGWQKALGFRSHERYAANALSGRLICRLKTASPLVIGAEQIKDPQRVHPTIVPPFVIGGVAAIPSSSLTGLISATAEAATNSALRVLEERFAEGFSALAPDLPPLGSKGRKQLTSADLLFGFVQQGAGAGGEVTAAMASRLSLSDGIAEVPPILMASCTLRELSSPKPWSSQKRPSPFYFSEILPRGRKFYVTRPAGRADGEPEWKSGNPGSSPHRKIEVRPIPAMTKFWFDIDFSNLDSDDLDMLCYALRPGEDYLHRLGMGKPIGLGLVQIEFIALFLIDRYRRYFPEAVVGSWRAEQRYSQYWVASDAVKLPDRRHDAEAKCLLTPPAGRCESPLERAARFRSSAPDDHKPILNVLEMLGRRTSASAKVTYPTVDVEHGAESGVFRWFQQNPGVGLPAISGLSPSLPALDENGHVHAGQMADGAGNAVNIQPDSLLGMVVEAKVVSVNPNNGVPQLQIDVAGRLIGASYQSPLDFKKAFKSIDPPEKIKVLVKTYNAPQNRFAVVWVPGP